MRTLLLIVIAFFPLNALALTTEELAVRVFCLEHQKIHPNTAMRDYDDGFEDCYYVIPGLAEKELNENRNSEVRQNTQEQSRIGRTKKELGTSR